MKVLAILTLGLAAFAVMRRRRPDLTERVEGAVREAAENVTGKDGVSEAAQDVAGRLREKAKGIVG